MAVPLSLPPLPLHWKASWLTSLPEDEQQRFLQSLTAQEKALLSYTWTFWAREKQLAPPGNWRVWLLLAGRGFGKTRTAAEWIRGEVESGRRGRLAFVHRTAGDVRDVMVEGESGILK